jgi:S1-C subfamily serine protease
MNPHFATRVLLVLLCSLCAGCFSASYSTTAQRRASVESYANVKVGQESLRDFLLERSAVVINEDGVTGSLKIVVQGSTLDFSGFGGEWNITRGFAAAIDHRGYLITAGHVVRREKGQPMLVFLGPGAKTPVHARVVWCGDGSENQPDIAILYAGEPLNEIFEWAPNSFFSEEVFAVGADYDGDDDENQNHFSSDYIAGLLLWTSSRTNWVPSTTKVHSSIPVHHGDSGGPLAAKDGRLLGVNTYFYHKGFSADAYRPDLDWLKKLIDEDFSKLPRPTN